jgi:hypothetical protein
VPAGLQVRHGTPGRPMPYGRMIAT